MLNSSSAAPTPSVTEVSTDRRIKRIDAHAHCLFHNTLDLLGPEATKAIIPQTQGAEDHFLVVENRVKAMDQMGIDIQVLSINPFWYDLPRELSQQIVASHNEQLAEFCARRPDRFAAFCSLSLQYPDLAVAELEKAITKQGLKGAAIGTVVSGRDFSDPMFDRVWAKAEELGAVLFLHPRGVPELNKRLKGNGWLQITIGNPLDTAIAIQHLIFDGTLDRYPGLKILAAHGGGYYPSYPDRSDRACGVSPVSCDPHIVLKKKPSEYLKQLYFDSLVFTPEALRHLVAEVGADRIVLGTDQPIPWELHPVEHVLNTPWLSDHDRDNIFGLTAAKLLNLND
jgi:aminocarboxymuconate-semialdehyde decarboxylase